MAWHGSLSRRRTRRLPFITSVKPTVVGGPMVDWPISASTTARGSTPVWAKSVAAARKRVVFPVSDAPKNMTTPGRCARASETPFQGSGFSRLNGSAFLPFQFWEATQLEKRPEKIGPPSVPIISGTSSFGSTGSPLTDPPCRFCRSQRLVLSDPYNAIPFIRQICLDPGAALNLCRLVLPQPLKNPQ